MLWEIAGLVLKEPFKTYPSGFPQKLIDKFVEKTGCGGVLANCPASGTAIIEQLYKAHQQTKYPIVYTSADSVFQIAVDIDIIPLETLYKWCEIARELLNGEYNEAWQMIMACKKLGIGAYYPTTIQDYIKYLLHHTNDKHELNAYLKVLEEYQNNQGKDFSYHMYETMSHIHRKLGHRKQADELMQKYLTIDEERQKEAKEIFKRY